MLQRNLGLLALIDEESQFPRASDKSLATKLHNTHSNDTNGIYRAPPDRGTTFGIMHYPGHVSAVSLVIKQEHIEPAKARESILYLL